LPSAGGHDKRAQIGTIAGFVRAEKKTHAGTVTPDSRKWKAGTMLQGPPRIFCQV
jgi:hypothetical protein